MNEDITQKKILIVGIITYYYVERTCVVVRKGDLILKGKLPRSVISNHLAEARNCTARKKAGPL